jgi:hypothetical protein
MARCALRALALPESAEMRPFLLPEVAIWASGDGVLIAGRADGRSAGQSIVGLLMPEAHCCFIANSARNYAKDA